MVNFPASPFLRRGLAALPLAIWIFVALCVFAAYFPAHLHGDAQVRWRWAFEMAGSGEWLDESDYFHPFLTYFFYGVLTTGLPVWTVHFVQLTLFYTGSFLLVQRLFGPAGRLACALLLLLPPVWDFSALQASDTWFLIGCFWYLAGVVRHLKEGAQLSWNSFSADVALAAFGSVLIFCTRYNTTPLLAVFLVAPFLFRLPWRRATGLAVAGVTGHFVSLGILAVANLPPAYKMEMLMASDVVGVWRDLHTSHPEAEPAFWEKVPDGERFFSKYDPHNHDKLVWTEPFFRARNLGPIAPVVREDFFRMMRTHPVAFANLKLRTFQNPWGFVEPLGAWYFKPAPDSYIEYLGLDPLRHRPRSKAVFRAASATLDVFFKHGGTVLMRPWIWWLAYLILLVVQLLRRRVDSIDALILFVAAGYFLTFFVFSNGFMLRYFMPVFVLLAFGFIRLLAKPDGHEAWRPA